MPAIDQCHHQIVHALQKDGWTVQRKPYVLFISHRRLYIDIYAENYQVNQSQRIVIVEAKCFQDAKAELNELYTAIGQYIIYRNLLRQQNVSDRLFLAIPSEAYRGVFTEFALSVIGEFQIKMIVVDLEMRLLNNG
jgi:XisH protein